LHTSVKFTKLLATAEMKSRVLLQNIHWNEMDRTGAGNSTDDSTKRRLYRAYNWKCVEPRPFSFMILELKEPLVVSVYLKYVEAGGGLQGWETICLQWRKCRWPTQPVQGI